MRKPVFSAIATAAAALSVAACSLIEPAPQAPAAPAPVYEGAVNPGSSTMSATYFRINISTGQVWSYMSGGPNQLTPIPDTPIPAGQYHLYRWSQSPDASGNTAWGFMRLDSQSGRMWMLDGGGNQPFTWAEVQQPPH